jgi:hypothetical protein
MSISRILLLSAAVLAACSSGGGPSVRLASVTGKVTSTSGVQVGGLRVVPIIFASGCAGAFDGAGSAATAESGDFLVLAAKQSGGSACLGINVERGGVVIGTATGRVAEFRDGQPFDSQVINVTIP